MVHVELTFKPFMIQPDQPSQLPLPSARPSGLALASWRVALPAILLLLALILVVYRDTVIAMVTIWFRSETFTHAFVVPPIVAWLIFRQRNELALLTPRPAFWVLLPLCAAVFSWLLGDLAAVNSITQLALVAMLVLAVPAVLGLSVARAIAFPLAFLFFAVPIGEFLLPQLMEWTANFTIAALRVSGVPVYREGLQFVIPSGNWSVIEACSGVRYLIASLTVGALFAYLNYQSTRRRVLFVLVSILIPIIANWMRAYMIVMLGHLSGNRIAVGVDHLIYGWVFFGVVIMLMFIVGARWSEAEPSIGGTRPSMSARSEPSSASRLWAATVYVLVIVTLPVIVKSFIASNTPTGVPALSAPASPGSGWQVASAGFSGFKPAFQNPRVETNSAYDKSGQMVGLYLAYYRKQDYGSKLVSSDNVVVSSTDLLWSRVGGGPRLTNLGQQSVTVQTTELRRLGSARPGEYDRLVAWQIYWINGTLTSSDYLAKAYSAAYRLMGRGDDSAVIVLYAAKDVAGGADATLESFLTANYGAIDAALRRAKGGD